MKILVIRFSSFGDVLQTLSVIGRLGESFPESEIHWVTRPEYVDLISRHPRLKRAWTLTNGSFAELWRLGGDLRDEGFTHVYDAHNNLRSRVIGWHLKGLFSWRVAVGKVKFLRRSIYRFRRYLLFSWRINRFPKPFTGQFALLAPLKAWGLSVQEPPAPQLFVSPKALEVARSAIPFEDFMALAPSAAFELKRWPPDHWRNLIRLCPQTKFVLLGGPNDQFITEIAAVAPERTLNLAGKFSLEESCAAVGLSRALVANDTGLMHAAEQMGRPCVALMGPAPFGYPGRPLTRILGLDLICRPCSKHGQGPCINPKFQQCLRDIEPAVVARALKDISHV